MYTILLVEDEKIELETLRDYVKWEKVGIKEVYTARNGRRALEIIESYEPDIIITDIQMTVMSGTELTLRVSEAVVIENNSFSVSQNKSSVAFPYYNNALQSFPLTSSYFEGQHSWRQYCYHV